MVENDFSLLTFANMNVALERVRGSTVYGERHEVHSCATDEEATRQARQLRAPQVAEVWQGERIVIKLSR